MKKLVILILAVVLSISLFADIRVRRRDVDSSTDSLEVVEASSYIFFSSALISVSSDDDYIAIKDRYDYFDYLLVQGEPVKAKDVFSDEGMRQFALNEEDIIDLDKVNVGILVSNLDRPVVLIPSDVRYSSLNERVAR